MSGSDSEPTGIPTRAIHEAYLDMQRALKQHRRATDRGGHAEQQRAHGELQDAVLTLYEMLRPHIKHNSGVESYWSGEPPSYPHNGHPPDPKDGTAIISWQIHPDTYQLNGINPEQQRGLADWHDEIGIADSVRLHDIQLEEGVAMIRYQTYEMGLRRLDEWRTEFQSTQTELGGFMGHKTREDPQRRRVPIDKLRRAARELAEAAEELGALSEFDASTPRTEITDELIEEVEEWRQENLES